MSGSNGVVVQPPETQNVFLCLSVFVGERERERRDVAGFCLNFSVAQQHQQQQQQPCDTYYCSSMFILAADQKVVVVSQFYFPVSSCFFSESRSLSHTHPSCFPTPSSFFSESSLPSVCAFLFLFLPSLSLFIQPPSFSGGQTVGLSTPPSLISYSSISLSLCLFASRAACGDSVVFLKPEKQEKRAMCWLAVSNRQITHTHTNNP